MSETQPIQDRRTKAQIAESEAELRTRLSERPVVVKTNGRNLTGPAALIAAGLLGGAFILSGGVKGGNEAQASYSPTPSASTQELATPKASEAGASPSPEASKSPEAVKIETFHLTPGDKFQAKAGDVVIGDVAMSDTEDASKAVFLFDTDTNKADGKDNTKTGMLVDVQKDGFVLAPYGGDVIRGLQGDKKTTWIDLKKAEMENGGCVGGCTDGVDLVLWTGSDTTVPQSGMKTEGNTVVANPSEAPTTGMTTDAKKQELLTLISGDEFKNLSADEQKKILDLLIQCICSGPVATPEAKPTPTPEVPCDTANDKLLKAGQKFTVKGNDFIIQGDVLVDGRRLYDNSEKTGAIDVFTDGKTHKIIAPYGADVQVFCATATKDTVKKLYTKDLSELKASGRTLDKKSVNQIK